MKNPKRTNYKNIEKGLDEMEKYRILVQTIPDIIYEVDAEGKFLFVSDAIKELGYSPRELIGEHFRKIVHPDDFETVSRILVLAKYKGKITGDKGAPKLFDERRTMVRMTKNLEARLLLKNPKDTSMNYCYTAISSSGKWNRPLQDKRKKLIGSIGIIKDITEHKEVEHALRKSEEFLFDLLNNSPHPILVVNFDTSMRYVNPTFEELTGFSSKELIGRNAPYPWWLEDTVKRNMRDFKKTIHKSTRRTEKLFQKKNGKRFWVEATSRLIKSKGKLKYCLIIWVDITNRKKAEEALMKAYEKLRVTQEQLIQAEKFETIGQLASGIAHEVKNPLGIILQAVNYLEKNYPVKKDVSQKKDISEVLMVINENIKRADRIVHALVDFSRVSELKAAPEDINPILGNSLNLVKHELKTKSIKVTKELKEDLPKVFIDKAKLEQVFINVYLNALQAMPHGGELFIRSYLTKLTNIGSGAGRRSTDYFKLGEEAVVVEIEDIGIGISEKNLSKVFNPFFTTKGIGKGTGLGLSVAKNILDMHRGFMEIKSEKGRGAKVIVKLKIAGGS